MRIILASGSPRRKELFKDITEDFDIIVSNADESVPDGTNVYDIPCYLSKIKALDIAKSHKNDIIIGCDTVVIKDGRVLGKPKDKTDAEQMMRFLSDSTHEVITGCCIIKGDTCVSFYERTKVTFNKMSDDEIFEYISSDEPYDKAGGYGIQGKAKIFISGICGDYFNVVGLPVARLKKELDKFTKNTDRV